MSARFWMLILFCGSYVATLREREGGRGREGERGEEKGKEGGREQKQDRRGGQCVKVQREWWERNAV